MKEKDAEMFWFRFNELRKRTGLKVSTVDSLCGFSKGRISVLKSRKDFPTLEETIKICKVLGCPYEFLIDEISEGNRLNDMVILYKNFCNADEATKMVIERLLKIDKLKIQSDLK